MRQILFKAKRKDNGEWVEGYYVKWEFAGDIGKRSTGILDVYMLVFKLATEQLKEKGVI